MLLVAMVIAWLAGIVVTDWYALPDSALWPLAGAGLAGTLLLWRRREWRLLSLLVLAAALGGLRYEPAHTTRDGVTIWQFADQGEIAVLGRVAEDPKRNDTGQQLLLETTRAQMGDASGRVSGYLLVVLPPYPTYRYGQWLVVTGSIREPPASDRPGAFDYRDYLARKGVFALMREPQVRDVSGSAPDNAAFPTRALHAMVVEPARMGLFAVRTHCHTLILRALPEPQASVASGMLLGMKASVPDETYRAFATSGMAHILVISGWHLSMVAGLMSGIASWLRLRGGGAFWFSVGAIWLYALFVGATPTVLRAATMASLVVLAASTERRTEPWTLLFAACGVLTLINPQTLWDLGFQLSALATAGIIAFHEPVQRWLERAGERVRLQLPWLTNTLAVTLAAQTLVLPLLLYHFGKLSLVFPVSNVVLVPVVPVAMVAGGCALLASLVAEALGGIAGVGALVGLVAQGGWLLAWVPLAWLTGGADLMASVPGSLLRVPPFPFWLLAGCYVVVAGWWVWRRVAPHWHNMAYNAVSDTVTVTDATEVQHTQPPD